MYLKFLKLFTLLNLHCKYNYLDQLPFDCKLRRMYLSILIKTIIIIIIIIIKAVFQSSHEAPRISLRVLALLNG